MQQLRKGVTGTYFREVKLYVKVNLTKLVLNYGFVSPFNHSVYVFVVLYCFQKVT